MSENQRKRSFEDADLKRTKAASAPKTPGKAPRKNLRALLIIIAALVLVGGVAWAAINLIPDAAVADEPTGTPKPDLTYISCQRPDIATIALTNASGVLTFSFDEATQIYRMKELPDASMERSSVESMFNQVSSLKGVELVAEDVQDLAQYGLDKPVAQIDVTMKDGTHRTFLLGNDLTGITQSYLMEQGSSRVVTIWTSASDWFRKAPDQFFRAALTALSSDEGLKSLRIEKPDVTVEIRQKDLTVETLTYADWGMVSPWNVDCEYEKVLEWMSVVSAVKASGYAGSLSNDGAAAYGLETPSMRITAIDPSGITLDINVGAQNEDKKYYVNEIGADAVVLVDAALLNFASTQPITLISRFINLYRLDNINGYTLKVDGQPDHKFTVTRVRAQDENGQPKTNSEGNPVYDETFFVDGTEIPDTYFKRFYQIVIASQIDGAATQGAQSETPVVEVIYHLLNGTNKSIKYMPYNRDFYLIDLDGARMFTLRQESVQPIIDRLADLLSGNYAVFD